mgnify:CR=1 FL=1
MKKFARCLLILILVVILSVVGGYFYEDSTITPMYESVSKIYVVPGSDSEASIRAKDGGLNKDFMIIFSSNVVIEAAQRIAGTSEDISEYLTVTSPADSNIVELKVINPDQNTAKTYVDAIAKTAVKTTTIIPVESMQILSEGTSTGNAFKPNLYRNTVIIAGMASAVCIFIELVVCLILCAFKKKEDHSDDEYEYEARFGRYVYPRQELIDSEQHRLPHDNTKKAGTDDILAAFDDDDDDDDNIDFLTKNAVDKHDETFKKEAAVARESESEPILNQEIKIESETVSKQEAPIKVEYESEVKEEAEPEPEAEPEVQVEAEPEPEAEPEVQEEAEPEPEAEPEVQVEAEPEIEAEPEVQVEAEPEIEAEPEVQEEAEPEPEAEPEVQVEAEPEAEPEVQEEAEPEPEAEPEVQVEAEPEPEAEPEVQVEAEPEIEAEPEVQAEAEPDEAEDVIAKAFAVQSEEDVVEPEPFIEPEPVFNVKILGRIVK